MTETTADTKPRRAAVWRSGPGRDLLLVVLGAILALAAEEWRDNRQRAERVRAALEGIESELRADSLRVAAARARHLGIVDTLEGFASRRELPPRDVYMFGMFNPASVSSIAWQTARETGALGDIPVSTVLALARAYEAQDRYHALGRALVVGIMDDIRRDGETTVLRDRFVQFIPIASDFANREDNLLEHYRLALSVLAEHRSR